MKTLPFFISVLLCTTLFAQEEITVPVQKKYQDELGKLFKDKRIANAMKIVEQQDDRAMEDLILLTEIEAPPFKEEKRGLKFAEMLKNEGADSVWIDEVGNVIALRRGKVGARTVVLDAHLDTVFPEGTDVRVRNTGDTLRAPGIGDDTRGLAIVLAVLRAMEAAKLETADHVLFVGTVGEEGPGDLRGVKHMFRQGADRIDSWIAIDGGDLGRISTMGLGSIRYRVTFKGPGGYSWGSFGLANPHHGLGSAIHYFSKSADEFTKSGPKTSYNVGIIGGGTSVNSIPYTSYMDIDMRSESPEYLAKIDQLLKESVQKALEEQNAVKRRGGDMTATFEMIGNRPSGEGDPNTPLVQRTMAATKLFGEEPVLTRGSTNGNIPISMGVPAVTIGRGGKSFGAHSLAEWYYNHEGWKATQLALLILMSEAGIR